MTIFTKLAAIIRTPLGKRGSTGRREDRSGASSIPITVALLKNDVAHLCLQVSAVADGVRVYGACRPLAFACMAKCVAVAKDTRTELHFLSVDKRDDLVIYEVSIPSATLYGLTRFFAETQQGRRTRIWTAGNGNVRLPPRWRFSKYHLNLTYDPIIEQLTLAEGATERCRIFVRNITVDDGSLQLDLAFIANRPLNTCSCALEIFPFRDESERYSVPVTVRAAKRVFRIPAKLHRTYKGMWTYNLTASVPFAAGFKHTGLYSLTIRSGDAIRSIYPYNRYYATKQSTFFSADRVSGQIFHHFADPVSKTIRIEFFRYDRADFDAARAMLSTGEAEITPSHRSWLFGEYPNTARDNAWSMFQKTLAGDHAISPKYVIGIKNRDGVRPDGKTVLSYGSVEHLRSCLHAEAVVFTHHPLYLMPDLFQRHRRKSRGQVVECFLQHGVTALKPLVDYHFKKQKFALFLANSKWEKQIIERHCDYPAERVFVAGMPRWDRLYAKGNAKGSGGSRRQKLLIFPTWRRGLDKLTVREFAQQDFYVTWRATLAQISVQAANLGVTVFFCTHSIIERFAGMLDTPGIRTISVRQMVANLPSFNVLLTDYSSLCFDFLFMSKPTGFFMFDRNSFFSVRQPYIQIPEELPGRAFETSHELIEGIFSGSGLSELLSESEMKSHIQRYIAFQDERNTERVIEAISARVGRYCYRTDRFNVEYLTESRKSSSYTGGGRFKRKS